MPRTSTGGLWRDGLPKSRTLSFLGSPVFRAGLPEGFQGCTLNPQSMDWSFLIGGDVMNLSDVPWLISGGSNSNPMDFFWLPPHTKSDDLLGIERIKGDVDAVWPAGREIRAWDWGKEMKVKSGVFKLRSHRYVKITGSRTSGYVIENYSFYFNENSFPPGWRLPSANQLRLLPHSHSLPGSLLR